MGERVTHKNEWNDEYPYPTTANGGGAGHSHPSHHGLGAYGRPGGGHVKVVDGKSPAPAKSALTPTQWKIVQVIDEVERLLIDKNNAYGNSFAQPIGVFSKADALAQLDVRIDDKLNRIARGSEYQGDDTELDLIGYLILKRVLRAL